MNVGCKRKDLDEITDIIVKNDNRLKEYKEVIELTLMREEHPVDIDFYGVPLKTEVGITDIDDFIQMEFDLKSKARLDIDNKQFLISDILLKKLFDMSKNGILYEEIIKANSYIKENENVEDLNKNFELYKYLGTFFENILKEQHNKKKQLSKVLKK